MAETQTETVPLVSPLSIRGTGDTYSTLTLTDIEEIRKDVAKDLVRRAKNDIKERAGFRGVADRMETGARVMAGLTSVLAFTGSAYTEYGQLFSFLAGIVGTVGVVMSGWSHYASAESNERLDRLNEILKSVGINPVPADPESAQDNTSGSDDAAQSNYKSTSNESPK
mmetsp:Transcript_24601/g.35287  ORF Transcript_24601/g.35287 Transcript_24601/m.35287 type:complete len:168 (+) Transcript_24601:224-727(+)